MESGIQTTTLRQTIMKLTKYQLFIAEVLKLVKNRPTKDEMQFAYIVYCGFNVSIKESINISLDNK